MPRAYDVRTVALALDVQPKWLDNLLSHHALTGVTRSRQGVERHISDDGVLAIQLVRLLADLGVSVARAASMTREILATRTTDELRFADESGIVLLFPKAALEKRIRERLIDALDAVPRIARGRPTTKKKNAERVALGVQKTE